MLYEVITRLEDRDDGVGRAAGGGEEALLLAQQLVVDAEDDVGDISLARRGENHLVDPLRLQVTPQPVPVAPFAGVIDEDGSYNFV